MELHGTWTNQKQMTSRLVVVDFDGVIAIPYTDPEMHYPQIPELFANLKKENTTLCLASFNPRAKVAVESWGLAEHFTAMRHGANFTWSGNYLESHRENMLKSSQIENMIANELKDHTFESIEFYDDDLKNLLEVKIALPIVKCIFIPHSLGLSVEWCK